MKLWNLFFVFVFFAALSSQTVESSNQADIGVKIVVLGSSTAAGHGPSSADSAWVNRYRTYVKKRNPKMDVVNLAVGGYTTYHILPDGSKTPKDRPKPSAGHNITAALSYFPNAIIINLPSNDCARKYTVEEQINNYKIVMAKADSANVPVWITTTQPCNYTEDIRKCLITMRDSTYAIWGNRTIDFWRGIAGKGGLVIEKYNSGDGVHLNDAAHRILFIRVVDRKILP
jgi:lysophospholipase L1-like esterase